MVLEAVPGMAAPSLEIDGHLDQLKEADPVNGLPDEALLAFGEGLVLVPQTEVGVLIEPQAGFAQPPHQLPRLQGAAIFEACVDPAEGVDVALADVVPLELPAVRLGLAAVEERFQGGVARLV